MGTAWPITIIAEQEARQIILNFDYLSMCLQFGMQSIHDSTVPAHFTFHAFNMQPCTWLHDVGIFCRQESAFSASQSSEIELSNAENSSRHSQRLASQREHQHEAHHEQESLERVF